MLTDAAIKSALREAPTSGKKSIELSDGGARGVGRLKLLIRVTENRLIVEWYATWWRNGKPVRAKLGTYPTISLRQARLDFAVNHRPVIVRGGHPAGLQARRVADASSNLQGIRAHKSRPPRKKGRRASAQALAISIARVQRRDHTLGPYDVGVDDILLAEAIIDDLERGPYEVVRVRNDAARG